MKAEMEAAMRSEDGSQVTEHRKITERYFLSTGCGLVFSRVYRCEKSMDDEPVPFKFIAQFDNDLKGQLSRYIYLFQIIYLFIWINREFDSTS